MFRQKANSNNFKFKMGRKAAETTHKVNSALGPGTANERTVQRWFKEFCKETRALKMRSMVVDHQKLTTINWEPSLSRILLQPHDKLAKNSVLTVLQSFCIWSKWERRESSISGCFMLLLLLLLSCFSHVWLCATPQTAAHQAPPSLGFSKEEHWNGLPFPSPMRESEKWKGSHSVVSYS